MISRAAWHKYISTLAAIDKKAATEMQAWIDKNGLQNNDALIQRAYAIATKYGEASAALSANTYDQMAGMMDADIKDALPAETATMEEIAKGVMYGKYHSPSQIPGIVGRHARQAGADTMMQNAKRDDAEWAWVPEGDTCAFCITLASNGWQKASRTVLNGNHADHIHPNCDCTFAIAFKEKDKRQYDYIYDPKKYRDMYYGADGDTPNERMNYIRRQIYDRNKDEINAQKRDAYQARVLEQALESTTDKNTNQNLLIGFYDKQYAETHAIDVKDVPEKSIDEIQTMADEMLNIANQYSQSKSTWTGKIEYNKDGAGFHPITHDIETNGHMNYHIMLHEILHSKSIGHYTINEYIEHMYEEELPVQLLTQEISRRIGLVEVNGGHNLAVERLRAINRDFGLFKNDYDFAMALYNTDLLERETSLRQLVIELAPEKGMSDQELDIALERIREAFHDILLG